MSIATLPFPTIITSLDCFKIPSLISPIYSPIWLGYFDIGRPIGLYDLELELL